MKEIEVNKRSIKNSLLGNTSKMSLKLKKIDTLIMDNKSFIISKDLCYKGIHFKSLELILKKGIINMELENENELENIYFQDYPDLGGITIPLDVLNDTFFKINVSKPYSKIEKINIIINNEIKQINVKDNIERFTIDNYIIDKTLQIRLAEKYNDIHSVNVKVIQFDSSGEYKEYYEKYFIYTNKNKVLDLRNYNTKDLYYRSKELEKLIVDLNVLKNTKLHHFNEVKVKELEILDNNDMKLIPNKLNYKNVLVTIRNNDSEKSILLKTLDDDKEIIIYLDEFNNYNTLHPNHMYKFLITDESIKLLNKNKELSYTLLNKEKIYKIDKMFINWCIANNINELIPEDYKLKNNLLELNEKDLKNIDDYIYKNLLNSLTEYKVIDKFKDIYDQYSNYLEHLNFLHEKGISYKTLYYLHKYNYDNITGITNRYTEHVLDNDKVIDNFNKLVKILIKRDD